MLTRRLLLATPAILAAARASAQSPLEVKVTLAAPFDGSNAAFFLAEERGWFREVGLRCQFDASGGSGDAVTRVGSGAYEFGVGDINVLLDFNAKNPASAARCIYMLYYRSPLSAASFTRSGITTPAALAGKRIGAALSDGAYRIFPAFAAQAGIDPASIRWQYGDLRLREAFLMRGDADAILGFDSTMYFGLVRAGARPADIQFTYFADTGLPLYGNGLLASKRMLETNPEAVRRFTLAAARGWQAAMAEPAAAIAALQKREALTDVPLETEKLRWLITRQLTTEESRADGLGGLRAPRFSESVATVSRAFGLTPPMTPELVFDPGFLPSAEIRKIPT
jgi:NitT/TauT family transport system substrate-binding protein